jgi:four helix bundle protein
MTEAKTTYYKKLQVWQKSIDLVEQVYRCTQDFPKVETYWLADQMRRASVSISSNIAEGSGRGGEAEYIHFLYIAKGSALELETQLIIAQRLKYIEESDFLIYEESINEIIKMIGWLISYKKSVKL